MSGSGNFDLQMNASIAQALGETMRATSQLDLSQSLPPEWLELVAQIVSDAEPA